MTEIKFCENNFSQGTDEVIDRLRYEIKNIKINVEACLGQCGNCATEPFAFVNDELVTADTPEELFDKIKELVHG